MVEALEAIRRRRSTGRLAEPAPTDDELRTILEAAVCAPDHGELRPWRFVVLAGDHRDAFGEVLADAYAARCAGAGVTPTEGQLTKERTKLGRAPVVVVAAAERQPDDKIPWIEQQFAVAAAVQNALLATTALGYGSMWRTGDQAYDDRVKVALGLRSTDTIIGFLYLGTPAGESKPQHEPSLNGVVTHWVGT